jgi:hypothetical protein
MIRVNEIYKIKFQSRVEWTDTVYEHKIIARINKVYEDEIYISVLSSSTEWLIQEYQSRIERSHIINMKRIPRNKLPLYINSLKYHSRLFEQILCSDI